MIMSSQTTSSSVSAVGRKSTSSSSSRLHSRCHPRCLSERANNEENNENDAVIEIEDNNNLSDNTSSNDGNSGDNICSDVRRRSRKRSGLEGAIAPPPSRTAANDNSAPKRRGRGDGNDQGGTNSSSNRKKKPRLEGRGDGTSSTTVQPSSQSIPASLSQYFPHIPRRNDNELSDAACRAKDLLAKSATIEESDNFPKFSSNALIEKLEEVAVEYSDWKNVKGTRKSAYYQTLSFYLDDGKGDPLVLKSNKAGDEMARLLNKIPGLYKTKQSRNKLRDELRTYFDKDGCFYGKLYYGMEVVLTHHVIWGRQIDEYNNGMQRIEAHLQQRILEEDRPSHFSSLPRCIIQQRDVERLRFFGSNGTLHLLSNMDSNTFKCLNMLRHHARNLGKDDDRTGMIDLSGAIIAKNTSKTSASAESVILTLSNALATMHEEYLPLRDIVVARTKEKLNELVQYHLPNAEQPITSVRHHYGSLSESICVYPERLSQQIIDVMHCLRLTLQFVFTARNSIEIAELMVTIVNTARLKRLTKQSLSLIKLKCNYHKDLPALPDGCLDRIQEILYPRTTNNGNGEEETHTCTRTYCSNPVEHETRVGRRGTLYLCNDATCQSQCEWGENGERCEENRADGSARFCGGRYCNAKFVQDRGITAGSRRHQQEFRAAIKEAKAAGRISN